MVIEYYCRDRVCCASISSSEGRLWHVGYFSSIHLLGRFATTTLPDMDKGVWPAEASSSMKRDLSGRTGHGRMLDADTVRTAAKNVAPKIDETNVRPWAYLSALA